VGYLRESGEVIHCELAHRGGRGSVWLVAGGYGKSVAMESIAASLMHSVFA
jgi:hypothetical protein